MSVAVDGLEAQLVELARQSTWFMPALRALRGLGLDEWCIGAGAVRNLVWDALHDKSAPSALSDVDVAFFDATNLSSARDQALQERLTRLHPDVPWEVTHQAGVHLWFAAWFGHAVPPLLSLDAAVASWPKYATSVGLSLAADESIRVVAPLGLGDLFAMHVRRNPARVSIETYRQRVGRKRYGERWPKVEIVPS